MNDMNADVFAALLVFFKLVLTLSIIATGIG